MFTKRRIAGLSLVLTAAVLAAACTSTEDSEPDVTTEPDVTETTETTATAPPRPPPRQSRPRGSSSPTPRSSCSHWPKRGTTPIGRR